MSLLRFRLHHLRNIEAAELEFADGCNLLIGPNASGKTSLLEGISLLATGRSFRPRQFSSVGSHVLPAATAHCWVQQPDGRVLEYGVERARGGQRFRISNEQVKSLAELAGLLPFQVITPEVSELVLGGPRLRRRFLDWGLFHVEPGFHEYWVRYRKLLRQRNAALRNSSRDLRLLRSWEVELAESAGALTQAYLAYTRALQERLAAAAAGAWPEWREVDLQLESGWETDAGLETERFIEQLRSQEARDQQRGYTSVGPHEAELRIRQGQHLARDVLSRGQTKLLATLLLLIQAGQLGEARSTRVLLLLDDLAAELDQANRVRVLREIERGPLQAVITGTQQGLLEGEVVAHCRGFHVEQGRVRRLA